MLYHKFIDGLRNNRLFDFGQKATDRLEVATLIHKAQKFDFARLPLECMDAARGQWRVPQATEDEMQFWREGYIPLPYPLCWYEFDLGDCRSGLLIMQAGTHWLVRRFDYIVPGAAVDKEDKAGGITYDGMIVDMDRNNVDRSVRLIGNKDFIDSVASLEEGRYHLHTGVAMNGPLAMYLTLMLNSKSTEISAVTPSARQNRERRAKGLLPLQAHRIVTIVPERYQYEVGPDGARRRSPRLHWRRSHLRRLDNGKNIVIARCLVGRADLGEVSHEYRIPPRKE